MQPRVLVIGGDSMIAKSLANKLTERGDLVLQTSRKKQSDDKLFLDLSDTGTFLQTNNAPKVDIVVICAAISKFSDCRNNNPDVYEVNVEAPVKIAEYYTRIGARVIFLSTAAIFDGLVSKEKADTLPTATNGYGRMKAIAEKQILATGKNIAVIRLSKILIPENTIFRAWADSLIKGHKIKAFTDQSIAPLTIEWAIRSILTVIDDEGNGTYQFSANADISYFDAACQLSQYLKTDSQLVETALASENGIPANEIANYNSLDSSRLECLMNMQAPEPISVLNNFFRELSLTSLGI